MGDAGFFRGTSAEQDNRFSDKEKKLLKQMKFADSISKKVDMTKVKLDVIKPWISNRIIELLGMEDDVLVEFVSNQLEAENFPDGRRIQINLTGFLNGKNARIFTGELWDLLISAQEQDSGIPISILEAKKEEIKQRQEDKQRVKETVERTLGHFLPRDGSRKDKLSSPPHSGKDSKDLVDTFAHSPDASKNSGRKWGSDRDHRFDYENRHSGRQYRRRVSRSRSRSMSPPKTTERNRERTNRNWRERERRPSPTPQQLIDAARGRDRRERERNSKDSRDRRDDYRNRGRRSPPRLRRRSRSPEQSTRTKVDLEEDQQHKKKSLDVKLKPKVEEQDESRSNSDPEVPEVKKRKEKPRDDSSDSPASKTKKKKKKSKKHRKQKKLKRKEVKEVESDGSESSDEDSDGGIDENEEVDEDDETVKGREDLEKSLRERALAAMKKRQEDSKGSSSRT